MLKFLARCLVALPFCFAFVVEAFAVYTYPPTTHGAKGRGTQVIPWMSSAPYADWGVVSCTAGSFTADSCAVTVNGKKQLISLFELDYHGEGPDSLQLDWKFPGQAAVFTMRIVGDAAKHKDYWAFQYAAEWVRPRALTTAVGGKWRWNSHHTPTP